MGPAGRLRASVDTCRGSLQTCGIRSSFVQKRRALEKSVLELIPAAQDAAAVSVEHTLATEDEFRITVAGFGAEGDLGVSGGWSQLSSRAGSPSTRAWGGAPGGAA